MNQQNFSQLTPQVTLNTGRVITGIGLRQAFGGTFNNYDAIIALAGYRAAKYKIIYSNSCRCNG